MTENVGKIDRILRAAIGALLVILALAGGIGGAMGWIAGLVGLVLLGTAAMKFCPAYRLLGMNTCDR